jgi:predicted Rossmann fold flavoprotein
MSGTRTFDAVVLGGGAAGLMFAATAGARGKRVCVLERNNTPGKKILISGGGRANFTNIHAKAENFISQNPHFVKSALAQYSPRDFLEFVERGGIAWHEKKLGQLFCNKSARDLLSLLLRECERADAELVMNAQDIRVEKTANGFTVDSTAGQFESGAVVVATGGLSIPKLGATGLGYDLARQFGLRIVETRPALVPLVLGGEETHWTKLAGVSADVVARAGKKIFTEKFLFTHRGLSGPAILQASSYLKPDEVLEVDLLAGSKKQIFAEMMRVGVMRDERTMRALLYGHMPQRLADALMKYSGGFTNPALEEFESKLRNWKFHPTGTEGYEKAEVTVGGVDTRDLGSSNLQARAVPGLIFIGEVVDVTGQLGGFNFQWAWSSAVAAARAL